MHCCMTERSQLALIRLNLRTQFSQLPDDPPGFDKPDEICELSAEVQSYPIELRMEHTKLRATASSLHRLNGLQIGASEASSVRVMKVPIRGLEKVWTLTPPPTTTSTSTSTPVCLCAGYTPTNGSSGNRQRVTHQKRVR
jgi:hypothetical protein